MKQDFAIIKVSWLTNLNGRHSSIERVHNAYRALILFLQKHNLTVHTVLEDVTLISGESRLMRSDLTDKGFELYKKVEKRWANGLDRGKDPNDMSVFEKELIKMSANPGIV